MDALPPAPVAGGNVETSQRIVDVLLRALSQAIPARVPAASAGTMSNLTIGGIDPRTGEPFTYYETAAGGMGARPGLDGISGVQTHMTNSLNTPIEALEYAYPFRVRRYAYRDGSGGAGEFRGGDGLIREVELLADAQVTLLADRRKLRPYGLQGGEEGAAGKAWLATQGGEEQTSLPGKCSQHLAKGDILHIETPGGGGWGNLRSTGKKPLAPTLRSSPNEQKWVRGSESKAVVGLRPSFSAHVRWCERRAPVWCCRVLSGLRERSRGSHISRKTSEMSPHFLYAALDSTAVRLSLRSA